MANETEYNTELTKIHHTNYVRNSRAIVVLWAIFTCIFFILNVVVFIQPHWIGDTGDSSYAGFLGLYEYCERAFAGDDYICSGDFIKWDSFLNDYFRATAVMVGVSCLMFIACIACFILFCLLNTATVLIICGWFQIASGLLMFISVIVYPGGWDNVKVRQICGLQAGQYDIGLCEMRWGYILAIVLVFDAFILAILAFVLAVKQANLLPEVYKKEKGNREVLSSPYYSTRDSTFSDPYNNFQDFYLTSTLKSVPQHNAAYVMD